MKKKLLHEHGLAAAEKAVGVTPFHKFVASERQLVLKACKAAPGVSMLQAVKDVITIMKGEQATRIRMEIGLWHVLMKCETIEQARINARFYLNPIK